MAQERSILIVDDEKGTRDVLARYLGRRFAVTAAEDGAVALELLKKRDFDLVLTDLRMPGADGMSVLEATLGKAKKTPCVVFTAYGSVENAVRAVKSGAADFVTKPVKLEQLDKVISEVFGAAEAEEHPGEAPSAAGAAEAQNGTKMLGVSPGITAMIEKIKKVAPGRATVLISGESGTGKEVAARLLHDFSGRKGLFIPIHCAALPGTLLESELFGHEKGAFTGAVEMRKGRFELADGGTILLDEIGEIDESVQIKLLRVLESRTVERLGSAVPVHCDARLVAATNKDLKKMVAEGKFREDLYYRLNVVQLNLPPLRERREDIAVLAGKFMREAAKDNDRNVEAISPEALRILEAYRWPGNVRELKNCIERMVVFANGPVLEVADVPEDIAGVQSAAIPGGREEDVAAAESLSGGDLNIENMEKRQIMLALEECGNNRTRAAEKLGISRRTLLRRLKKYGI